MCLSGIFSNKVFMNDEIKLHPICPFICLPESGLRTGFCFEVLSQIFQGLR
jgi:hypothetical protein